MAVQDPSVEGRLLALRQVLAMLVAGQDCDRILDALARAEADGQEDPGAVESPAYRHRGRGR